jgi:ABC-type Na+ efflux pump permease subunit
MKPSPTILTPLYRASLVAWKDLQVQFQSPVLLVFLVAMPLGMIFLTGMAFVANEARPLKGQVAVVVPGDPAGAAQKANKLQHAQDTAVFKGDLTYVPAGPMTEEEAQAKLQSGELSGVLFYPDAGAGTPHLRVGPNESVQRFAVVSAVGDRVAAAEGHPPRSPVMVEAAPPAGPGFQAFGQAVAGNGVMFILLNCIMSGALGLIRERRLHTLDRLLIAPLSRGTILFGKILGVYVLGVLQAVVIFGFGLLVGVKMGDLLGVTLVTLMFILVGCSMGLMISALARREENVQMLGGPVGLVMAALGGGMFPLEMAPAWMRWIALAFPTGWAMNAYHALMFDGASVAAVWPNLLALVGFAALFFLIGVRSLRWE